VKIDLDPNPDTDPDTDPDSDPDSNPDAQQVGIVITSSATLKSKKTSGRVVAAGDMAMHNY